MDTCVIYVRSSGLENAKRDYPQLEVETQAENLKKKKETETN